MEGKNTRMVKDLGWFGNELPSKEDDEREKRKEKETDKKNKGYLKGDKNRNYEHRLKERGGEMRELIGDKIRERNSLRKERLTAHHPTPTEMEANRRPAAHKRIEEGGRRYERGYRGTGLGQACYRGKENQGWEQEKAETEAGGRQTPAPAVLQAAPAVLQDAPPPYLTALPKKLIPPTSNQTRSVSHLSPHQDKDGNLSMGNTGLFSVLALNQAHRETERAARALSHRVPPAGF